MDCRFCSKNGSLCLDCNSIVCENCKTFSSKCPSCSSNLFSKDPIPEVKKSKKENPILLKLPQPITPKLIQKSFNQPDEIANNSNTIEINRSILNLQNFNDNYALYDEIISNFGSQIHYQAAPEILNETRTGFKKSDSFNKRSINKIKERDDKNCEIKRKIHDSASDAYNNDKNKQKKDTILKRFALAIAIIGILFFLYTILV